MVARYLNGVAMSREKLPASLALLLFAAAWFLPVEAGGARLSEGILPGYEAFVVAIAPVTLHPFSELDLVTIREILTALSALSNLLMLYAMVLVLGWPRVRVPGPKRLSLLLWVAFVINAQWIWPRGGEFLDLRFGYWLWCLSFAFVAIAVRRLERRKADVALLTTAERRAVRAGTA